MMLAPELEEFANSIPDRRLASIAASDGDACYEFWLQLYCGESCEKLERDLRWRCGGGGLVHDAPLDGSAPAAELVNPAGKLRPAN
jgi:hypothetical protein